MVKKNIKFEKDSIKNLNNFVPDDFKLLTDTYADNYGKMMEFLSTNKKLELSIPLSNYVIISYVRYIESYFKNLAIGLIDGAGQESPELNVTFSIRELAEIKEDGDITAGKIFASETNFQRLDVINSVFSTLLGQDFFKMINQKTDVDWKKLHEIIDERHEIIHESKDFSKDYEQLHGYGHEIMKFIIISSNIVTKFINDLTNEMKKKSDSKV